MKRRSFTDEFKADAVKLVLAEGRTVGQVAKDLDLTETALRAWVRQAEVEVGEGLSNALTTEERHELSWLRPEVKQLRVEREILKGAAAHSSGQSSTFSSSSAGVLKPRVFRGR